ncbi:hypothetical protein M0811_11954 [Anaeramoeba ignava]|uniref:FYVE-type domain-containing protein n=1 Tax=Anaeramoeba ignava TaxID=1746090 RepID=A0A9Q0R6I9_ANAIG|nr:hypothetical protein M0811_11954 [Anaeramoeba ignava]
MSTNQSKNEKENEKKPRREHTKDNRIRIATKIYKKEKIFQHKLKDLIHYFIHPFENSIKNNESLISKEKFSIIIRNLKEIKIKSEEILKILEETIKKSTEGLKLNDFLLLIIKNLPEYSKYILNNSQAIKELEELKKESKFFTFCQETEKKAGNSFLEYLGMPEHQIFVYQTLITKIKKLTPKENPDFQQIENALIELQKITSKIQKPLNNSNENSIKKERPKVCSVCQNKFTANRKRYRCRKCQKYVCKSCFTHQISLKPNETPVRVCDNCYKISLEQKNESIIPKDDSKKLKDQKLLRRYTVTSSTEIQKENHLKQNQLIKMKQNQLIKMNKN